MAQPQLHSSQHPGDKDIIMVDLTTLDDAPPASQHVLNHAGSVNGSIMAGHAQASQHGAAMNTQNRIAFQPHQQVQIKRIQELLKSIEGDLFLEWYMLSTLFAKSRNSQELVGHLLKTPSIIDQPLAHASDSFLDKAMRLRLLTISAPDLLVMLADADRLGYQEDSDVEDIKQVKTLEAAAAIGPRPDIGFQGQHHQPPPPQARPYDGLRHPQQPVPVDHFSRSHLPSNINPAAANSPLSSPKHQCKECGKSFTQSGGLNYHTANKVCKRTPPVIDANSKFKAYCPQCNKGFTTVASMKNHMASRVCASHEMAPATQSGGQQPHLPFYNYAPAQSQHANTTYLEHGPHPVDLASHPASRRVSMSAPTHLPRPPQYQGDTATAYKFVANNYSPAPHSNAQLAPSQTSDTHHINRTQVAVPSSQNLPSSTEVPPRPSLLSTSEAADHIANSTPLVSRASPSAPESVMFAPPPPMMRNVSSTPGPTPKDAKRIMERNTPTSVDSPISGLFSDDGRVFPEDLAPAARAKLDNELNEEVARLQRRIEAMDQNLPDYNDLVSRMTATSKTRQSQIRKANGVRLRIRGPNKTTLERAMASPLATPSTTSRTRVSTPAHKNIHDRSPGSIHASPDVKRRRVENLAYSRSPSGEALVVMERGVNGDLQQVDKDKNPTIQTSANFNSRNGSKAGTGPLLASKPTAPNSRPASSAGQQPHKRVHIRPGIQAEWEASRTPKSSTPSAAPVTSPFTAINKAAKPGGLAAPNNRQKIQPIEINSSGDHSAQGGQIIDSGDDDSSDDGDSGADVGVDIPRAANASGRSRVKLPVKPVNPPGADTDVNEGNPSV